MKKINFLLLLVSLGCSSQLFAQTQDIIWVTLMGVTGVPSGDRALCGISVHYGDKTYVDPTNGNVTPFVNAINWVDSYTPSAGFELMGIVRPYALRDLWTESKSWIGTEDGKSNDTLYLQSYNLGHLTSYHLQVTCNFNVAYTQIGKLNDNYTSTSTPLAMNGATVVQGIPCGVIDYPFTIIPGDPAGTLSKSVTRFMVVLSKNASYRPFAFTHTQATRTPTGDVVVQWKAKDEEAISSYEVQVFRGGKFFTERIIPRSGRYSITGEFEGVEKLRIKTNMSDFSKTIYSDTITITRQVLPAHHGTFTVFPNPIQGRVANLHFDDDYGRSTVQIRNMIDGQVLRTVVLTAHGNIPLSLTGIPMGNYLICAIPDDKSKVAVTQKIIVP